MLINNYIFSEHSGFMHIAKFNCACLKTLKTGPAMAGLAGPTPTALTWILIWSIMIISVDFICYSL